MGFFCGNGKVAFNKRQKKNCLTQIFCRKVTLKIKEYVALALTLPKKRSMWLWRKIFNKISPVPCTVFHAKLNAVQATHRQIPGSRGRSKQNKGSARYLSFAGTVKTKILVPSGVLRTKDEFPYFKCSWWSDVLVIYWIFALKGSRNYLIFRWHNIDVREDFHLGTFIAMFVVGMNTESWRWGNQSQGNRWFFLDVYSLAFFGIVKAPIA